MDARPRVYVDTSVFGGVFDEGFERGSLAFFEKARSGYFAVVTSALVAEEISLAPEAVRDFYQGLAARFEVADVTKEARQLRNDYIEAGVVTPKSMADALHVAIATVAGCPLIVSWNFKHIVHYQKIPRYNAVNASRGYAALRIHSPLEVTADEE